MKVISAAPPTTGPGPYLRTANGEAKRGRLSCLITGIPSRLSAAAWERLLGKEEAIHNKTGGPSVCTTQINTRLYRCGLHLDSGQSFRLNQASSERFRYYKQTDSGSIPEST